MRLKGEGFAQALFAWLCENFTGSVTFSAGQNATLGNLLDVADLGRIMNSKVILTLFDEGGNLARSGRRHQQERTFRFVMKGNHGQAAIDLCWEVLEFLENQRRFESGVFSVWLLQTETLPSTVATAESGLALSDFVVTFLVSTNPG